MPNPCAGANWQAATLTTRQAWAEAQAPCALCGGPINYELRWPHHRSLTVDHRTPRWAGGAPLDPSNWQPAHLTCNSRRGGQDKHRKQRLERRTARTW